MPGAFAPNVPSRCWRVTRTEELEEAMADSIGSDKLTLVEVMLPKMDIPDFLRAVTQALEERNSRV
ncbi:Pyruvate decarboxylase; Alpha-keto-acid decarboxylase [Raoultella ornithinolytica]|nr:Pyruvate decarboxylase; Alpha-keto-acid decarboxylase [Raoultella ornithinolytica]